MPGSKHEPHVRGTPGDRAIDLGSLRREIAVRDEGRPGPLVLITAGLHGNEPAGVAAVERLFEALGSTPTGGRLLALAGNLGALRTGDRHRGQDLNRLWTEENLLALAHRDPFDDRPDEVELRALFSLIEAERDAARARGREVVLLDLHSTSARGGAFSVVADSIPSRRLARAIGLPVVLGLEQRIEGPLMTWLVSQGDTATVVEGGQHEDPATADVLYDALWVALDHVGVLPEEDERVTLARTRLESRRGDSPRVLDLVYAHVIEPEDGFVMEPGWTNFRTVVQGQTLALQRGEIVQAPLDGYMLMPLYQGLGTEGFFLCRPVGSLWLFASRVLRRSFAESALRILPSVHSLDSRAGEIVVDRGSPAWLNRVLHLFGFRKNAPIGERTVWTRRPQG
ncbi:MAG: succinylglutamate desuccinylase/aspartoacylase family protein [Planctomycetota bacterium]